MASEELVRYRRAGGMAGLDQRLTVYDDGRAVLDDRKARAQAEIQATQGEIARLSSLIDSVPADRWKGTIATVGRVLLPRPHESMRFELRRGSRSIGGAAGRTDDAELAPLLAELDALLARAVRERRA